MSQICSLHGLVVEYCCREILAKAMMKSWLSQGWNNLSADVIDIGHPACRRDNSATFAFDN